jgi:ABC-type Fe3+-hydroxamate transport system substrate-binding protein
MLRLLSALLLLGTWAATAVPATASAPVPVRVVTLMPSLGELAYDLAADPERTIVGVSEYSDYPPALKQKPSIGPYFKVNLERIAALKPDLILASTDGNTPDQIAHLRELKLRVVVIDTRSFAEIEASMRAIGRALGQPDKGERMAQRFAAGLAEARARAQGRAPRRLVVQLGENPLVVAGGKTFLNEAVEIIGAKNLYADSPTGYPRPALEDVLKRAPEQVVVLAMGTDRALFARMRAGWDARKGIRATVVEADALARPSFRLIEGIARLEKAVYGQP